MEINLKNIKKDFDTCGMFLIGENKVKLLIEQAEKVERLEKETKLYGSAIEEDRETINRLLEIVERYEKALRYISITKDYSSVDWVDIIEDYENKAKEALEL